MAEMILNMSTVYRRYYSASRKHELAAGPADRSPQVHAGPEPLIIIISRRTGLSRAHLEGRKRYSCHSGCTKQTNLFIHLNHASPK